VPEPALLPFAGWESFYVIGGSSAAALTGLNFVVIALGSETRETMSEAGVRAYTTPTIVHFCFVLLVSAILSAPWHWVRGAAGCLTASALAGLVYSSLITYHATRQTVYKPVFEDWMFHNVLPIATYGTIALASILLPRYLSSALFVIAGGSLLLLFVGIHNAWDSVIWMVMTRQKGARD
jgi:hypothetical protein